MTSQHVPGRTPKRQARPHPSASPIVYPGGNTLPFDPSYISPQDDLRPHAQFTQSHSDFTLSPAHLMPPPPVPPSSQFQSPQSMFFSSPSSVDSNPNYFSTYTQTYPSPFYDMSYPVPPFDYTDDGMSYMEFDPRLSDMESDMMSQSVAMSDIDTKTDFSVSMASTSPSKASTKTPRPPNAWILYRSDKLKAIAAGEVIPGLNEVVAELNHTGSSASPSNESGEAGEKKTRQRAPKKGTRPPTEGLLSLGRGKLGRGIPQADISKMISMLWKRESSLVRDRYENLALMKKHEHQLKYPDYKFQPQRKADKIRAREEKEREREAIKREKEAQKGGRAKKTRSKANRYSPTATSTRTDRSNSYQVSSLESGADSGWQSGALVTPMTESPLPLPRLNPFPMPPVSLPSMNAEDHAGPKQFDLALMEPVNEEPKFLGSPDMSSLGSSPERLSTAPDSVPTQMVPEMVYPQPTYPLLAPLPIQDIAPPQPPTQAQPVAQPQSVAQPQLVAQPQPITPPRPQPIPGQPLQRQQQQPQGRYPQDMPQPDTPSIIDVGSEMQMQLQPGMSDIATAPPTETTKSKAKGKKVPKKKPKANQLVATWGEFDEDSTAEPKVIDVVDSDDEDDNMEGSTVVQDALDVQDAQDALDAQDKLDTQVAEIEMVEQAHAEMEPDRKGKKKETRRGRPPTKPLTSTEPLIPRIVAEPEHVSSDLYHVHAGPYTVEYCVENGQTINKTESDQATAVTVQPIESPEPAEEEEDSEYAGFTIPPGMTIGEFYDLRKQLTEYLVATPAVGDPTTEARKQVGLSTEINAHIENQNGQQVIVPDEWDPAQLTMLRALIHQVPDQGPTISGAPLFSPMDPMWTLSPTQTSFGDNIGNDPSIDGRRVTSFSVTKSDGQLLPFTVVPRHISESISPGIGSGTDGQWTRDRLLSFGDAGMIFGAVGNLDNVPQMDISEDEFMSSFVITSDEAALVVNSDTSTPAPASGGLESFAEEVEVVEDAMEQDAPVASAPSSASSNKTVRVPGAQEEDQKTPTTRSMRGGIRGRAVGRKFDEAAGA